MVTGVIIFFSAMLLVCFAEIYNQSKEIEFLRRELWKSWADDSKDGWVEPLATVIVEEEDFR